MSIGGGLHPVTVFPLPNRLHKSILRVVKNYCSPMGYFNLVAMVSLLVVIKLIQIIIIVICRTLSVKLLHFNQFCYPQMYESPSCKLYTKYW